jgi:Tfp pilus assembly protein PilO
MLNIYIPTYAQISNVLVCILHHLFVHVLVYNKHLSFKMHGMNIKVMINLRITHYSSPSVSIAAVIIIRINYNNIGNPN